MNGLEHSSFITPLALHHAQTILPQQTLMNPPMNMMSDRKPKEKKGIRRGTKVSERPGFVTIIAKASVSEAHGQLEVPVSEYNAFEEAERIKSDRNASKEDKAVAAINARKYLNKWRERWATS